MTKRLTLADRLQESIEEGIATGDLPPGAQLDEAELTRASKYRERPCGKRCCNWPQP